MKSLQLNRPHILILIGVPGSGRTAFAKRFSNLFQAPYVDAKSFAPEAANIESLPEIGCKIVEQLVKTNQTIVYEGVTGTRTERQDIVEIAKNAGYSPLLVWFQINQTTAKIRAEKNSRKAHPILFDVYDHGKLTVPNEREPYVVVSGMHTYPAQAKTVLKRLTELTGRSNKGGPAIPGARQQANASTSARPSRVQ